MLCCILFANIAWGQTVVLTPSTTAINPAGAAVTFTASLSYATPPSVLAFTTTLPAGWFYSGGINQPPVAPAPGTTGLLSWSYITTPASPATFSFTLTYGPALSGYQVFTTSLITRDTSGAPAVTTPGPTLTLIAPPASAQWNGGTASWNDPAQWSGGIVPNDSGNATFKAIVASGATTLTSPVTLTELQFSGGAIGGHATMTLQSTASVWNGGAFSGLEQLVITSGAALSAEGSASHDFTGTTITNQGQFLWRDSGALRSGNDGRFVNAAGATFVDASNAAGGSAISSLGGTFSFSNAGTYTKTEATETRVSVPFANTGNILVVAGKMRFDSDFTQSAGSLYVANGASVQFQTPLNFTAGSLVVAGTVVGDVNNAAFMSPGSLLGTMVVQGNLTLLSTSVLWIDISGNIQGTGYDFVDVTGTAALGGNLALSLLSNAGAVLRNTDTFVILRAGAVTGSFLNVANGARLDAYGMGSFQVDITGTSVVLSNFSPIPEPQTWVLFFFGVSAVSGYSLRTWTSRRQRSRRN